jgi:hypothetical protein
MAFLTDLSLAPIVNGLSLIHVVNPSDTTQNPAGSSYQTPLQTIFNLINPVGITGGTYNANTGVITFYTSSGGTFDISGFTTGYTDIQVTGYTYDNNNTFTISETDGTTHSATINQMSGLTVNGNLTVTGNTSLQGLTATTISASTYQNLPTDIRVTGATYSNNTFTYTNNTGGTFSVLFNTMTGLTINGDLTVTGNTSLNSTTASTLTLSSVPTTDTSINAQYLTRDSSTGLVKTKTSLGPTVYGLFAQTGNSVAVSATTSELSVIDGGIGTLSVPASGFSIGDSFRADFGGIMSAKNNDTLRIRVKSGSVVLADSGTQTMTTTLNDVWQLSINFTIRKTGGTGTASIVTLGVFHSTKQSNGTPLGFAFNTVNSTTFDTTISNTLDVTAQWGSNSALNSIYSDIFILNKIY